MNAETLIGTVLGTCTLQKLIGQGGMGAVFLAQQSRPKRQVAVKVLLPMIPLNPDQLAAFLERFRRETDAAAALEHPNIMPVHEYGEYGGLAYLVMPYISGGTLRDVLEREGPLTLAKAANYLEQLAAAIDSAHDHGVIHRDIKPANIMVTPEGRLLLGDFGLVKIIAEGQSAMVRLTGAGAPVGTPDYMAPEQVIGDDVDTRADLYSLGILLFQLVTGTTPFRGETPMQIAAQHLRLPPPSPLMLRPDLPIRAEQVIQRAMAKKPADRYLHARDLANAFRQALLDASIELEPSNINGMHTGSTGAWRALPKRQFEPLRQTASPPKPGIGKGVQSKTAARLGAIHGSIPDTPAISEESLPAAKSSGGGLLSRTGKFAIAGSGMIPVAKSNASPAPVPDHIESGVMPIAKPTINPALAPDRLESGVMPIAKSTTGPDPAPDGSGNGLLSRTGKFPMIGANSGMLPATMGKSPIAATANSLAPLADKPPSVVPIFREQSPVVEKSSSEALVKPETQERPNRRRQRTNPVKPVQISDANQDSQSLIGLIPITPQPQEEQGFIKEKGKKKTPEPWMKALMVMVTVLAIFAAVGILLSSRSKPSTPIISKPAGPPNTTATATAHLTAIAQANIILSDPLNRNIHGWYMDPRSPNVYTFKNGAYHITDDNDQNGRASILSTNSFGGSIGYQVTMEEITGNDTNANNSFGMIFRFSQQSNKKNKDGDPIITFYSFEVVNIKQGGEYYFWKYDNTNPDNPWTQIQDGKLPLGSEFHQGQGPQAANTIKILMSGDKFTVTVNGTTLPKTFQDASLTQGMVGMIVNLKGTEVAFSNLLITRN
jgi:serine/threonine protein kinase